MHAHVSTDTVEIVRTTYTNRGATIGEIFHVPGFNGMVHLAFAHDWDGDATEYDPLCCDAFADVASAEAEIKKRARYGQAPVELPDVDELPIDLANRVPWNTFISGRLTVISTLVGENLVACNPVPFDGETPILVIDGPEIDCLHFRVHDDDVEQTFRLVVAALILAEGQAAGEPVAQQPPDRTLDQRGFATMWNNIQL